MRTTSSLLGLFALALAACSSSDNDADPGSVEMGGTGGQSSVPVTSVASMTGPLSGRDTSIHANIVISDLADTCGTFVADKKHNAERASSTTTTLLFGLDSRTLATGDYSINYRWGREPPLEGRFATAAITTNDAKCTTELATSTSGEINVEEVDDTGVQGTFSVQFEDGTMLDGTFDAPSCPDYLNVVPDRDAPDAPVCTPREE